MRQRRTSVPSAGRILLAAAAFGIPAAPASAAELQIEGYYRARARAFDTLSLNRDLANSEGFASYVQHRLWLRPKILVSDEIGVFVDLRALDNLVWGNEAVSYIDPSTGAELPLEFMNSLQPPATTEENAEEPPTDITLWRAWGEAHTPAGNFKFGRMPLSWGMGIWQNDGLAIDAEYGDTADRLQWEYLFDEVFVRLAYDIDSDVVVNDTDDTTSYNGAVAFRSEETMAGLQAQLKRTPSRTFNLFSIDATFDASLGVVGLGFEFVGQFGAGDLANGANDVSVTAFGSVLDIAIESEPVFAGLEGGFASGDSNAADQKIKAFAFDRDYNVALMMFEQPMPTLAASIANDVNRGRDYETALTGPAVQNALYLRPTVGYWLHDGLSADVTGIFARVARLPEGSNLGRSYGMEFDATVRYRPYDPFEVAFTFGAFIPGGYYADYSDDTYSGFDAPAFGGQLNASIEF